MLIVAYRSADKLASCIRSVRRYLPELEAASGTILDRSPRRCVAAATTPGVHWYLHGPNIGFASAVNRLSAMFPGP